MTQPDPSNKKLRPEMHRFLAIEGRARLNACWEDLWVPTAAASGVFKALQDCVDIKPSTKPNGLIVTGDADTGKSRTLQAFRDRNPPVVNEETEYADHPVLYLIAPNNPSPTALLKKVLEELGHPVGYKTSEEDLRSHTLRMLRSCRVKTLIIDEFGDIQRDQTNRKVVEFLRFLKGMINETGRPFVIGGTPVILDLIASENQIRGRLDNVVHLKPFSLPEFTRVLLAYERLMPLRRETDFRSEQELILKLHDRSAGFIGRLSNLLRKACAVAIENGTEKITLSAVDMVPDLSLDTVGRKIA